MPVEEQASDGRRTAALRCRDVCVEYNDVTVLHDVAMDVEPGEVVALLGASGSGKSTLLNAIAGLVSLSRGEIWVGGQRVAGNGRGTPAEQRDVGMVFQNFALWPHLSVLDTVAYPLRRAGHSSRAAAVAAANLLDQLEIGGLARRRPAELSGGEQQRVGLARALARNAGLYLLDEPTAHLDTHLRAAFQQAVLARQRDRGAAVIYATHDAGEALALADRVALMVSGRLIQLATPVGVYCEPVSLAAAALTGSCSVLAARVTALPDGALSLGLADGSVGVIGADGVAASAAHPHPDPGQRSLLVRPDWVHVGGPFSGRVTSVAFRGAHTEYLLQSAAASVLMSLPGPSRHHVDDVVPWGLSRAWILDADADSTGQVPVAAEPSQPSAVIALG